MVKMICIHKHRDTTGKIYGYRLKYPNGPELDMDAYDLKRNIESGQIEVVNLTLTSDGRLVDRTIQTNELEMMTPVIDPTIQPQELNKVEHKLAEKNKEVDKQKTSAEKFGLRSYINSMMGKTEVPSKNTKTMSTDPNKYNGLEGLKRYASDFAETHLMGRVTSRRYEDDADEDGFAVFITNHDCYEFRYKILLDIAESGIVASMDIKDTPLINYNRIEAELSKENLDIVLKYMVKSILDRRMDKIKRFVVDGKITSSK